MIKIIIIVGIIIFLLFLYNKYSPKVDIILSNGNYVRTYKRLLIL